MALEYLACSRCLCTLFGAQDISADIYSPVDENVFTYQLDGKICGIQGPALYSAQNPQGNRFDLVRIVSGTMGLVAIDSEEPPVLEATWCPGLKWIAVQCGYCSFFLGWRFLDEEDKIIHHLCLFTKLTPVVSSVEQFLLQCMLLAQIRNQHASYLRDRNEIVSILRNMEAFSAESCYIRYVIPFDHLPASRLGSVAALQAVRQFAEAAKAEGPHFTHNALVLNTEYSTNDES